MNETSPESYDTTIPRAVTVVSTDDTRRELLRAWLESRGWTVRTESDGRRALRRWVPDLTSPFLFLDFDEDDLSSFELLAGVAAHRIAPRVIVEARLDLAEALRPLGVESVLPRRCRFHEVGRALDALRAGALTRAA